MSAGTRKLDVVGIGSMVVDRVHRTPRILGSDAKGLLRDVEAGVPVVNHVGGDVLPCLLVELFSRLSLYYM